MDGHSKDGCRFSKDGIFLLTAVPGFEYSLIIETPFHGVKRMSAKMVESLKKGLEILGMFSNSGPSLKLAEITRKTGLPKSTAYRLLQTLISLDYVHYFPDSTTYRLGPKVMSLGFSTLSSLDLTEAAQPYLEDLSQRIQQNVNLGILDGCFVVYIIRIKSRRILNIDLRVGSRLSTYNTAIGWALLAYTGQDKLQSIIDVISQTPEVTSQIGPDGNLLKQKLALVREHGYALADDEFVSGLRSIAAPIFDEKGMVEGAINLPVFSQLCSNEELISKYLPLLLQTAQTVSQLRGYSPRKKVKMFEGRHDYLAATHRGHEED